DCNTTFDSINTLRGTGTVNFAPFGFLGVGANNGTSTFDGSMIGSGYPNGYALGKSGSGIFTLTGTNTFTSDTHIFSGKLLVNGYQPQSRVWVESTGTLGGNGTVGEIIAYGTVSPGSSPGVLTSSNLFFGASGVYEVQLSGRNAGTGYDQV